MSEKELSFEINNDNFFLNLKTRNIKILSIIQQKFIDDGFSLIKMTDNVSKSCFSNILNLVLKMKFTGLSCS